MFVSRSVLKDFIFDASNSSAGSLFQNGQHERCMHGGGSGYNISVGGTNMPGRIALDGLDGRRWIPWEILEG